MNRFKGALLGASVATVAAAATVYAQFPSFPPETQAPAGGVSQNATFLQDPSLIFPVVRLIEFERGVGRLDTTTGELWRFNGTLAGSSAGGTWTRVVRPVSENTSGFLEISQVGTATFLVDVVTGETWILRGRNTTAIWNRVAVR